MRARPEREPRITGCSFLYSSAVSTLTRRMFERSLADNPLVIADCILRMRLKRGSERHAGVTTLSTRYPPKPTGCQQRRKLFPLGRMALTNFLTLFSVLIKRDLRSNYTAPPASRSYWASSDLGSFAR